MRKNSINYSKKIKLAVFLAIFIVALIIFSIFQNNSIVVTEADYSNPNVPSEFDGFIIVQISDLHNKMFGKEQRILLDKVERLSPDIIVVTGDLIDRRKYDLATGMIFISGAIKIAPVYYVSGNHEAWSGKFPEIEGGLVAAGVNILDNTALELEKGESSIQILGLADPGFLTSKSSDSTYISKIQDQLEQLDPWLDHGNFNILLSHRPELFDLYCENKLDLVFAGHAHGGQIRLPLIGGLWAPHQGLFPKYTSGSYSEASTTMFVSRGLGNSVFPGRIFNRPEIVAVTLKTD